MKTALQKLWVTLLAVVSLIACGSPEPMTDDELRQDMIKDGWTTEQIEGFFAMYA